VDVIYLLDTNVWSHYLNRRNRLVVERIRQTPPAQMRLCSVVKAELYYGAYYSNNIAKNLAILQALFEQVPSLPFDDGAAEQAGRIHAELSKRGERIGPNDLLITAIALVHGAVVVTHNTGEFGRVSRLGIQDWELPGG
jgi:tRNA(fMet)-specific endonuclease VapC